MWEQVMCACVRAQKRGAGWAGNWVAVPPMHTCRKAVIRPLFGPPGACVHGRYQTMLALCLVVQDWCLLVALLGDVDTSAARVSRLRVAEGSAADPPPPPLSPSLSRRTRAHPAALVFSSLSRAMPWTRTYAVTGVRDNVGSGPRNQAAFTAPVELAIPVCGGVGHSGRGGPPWSLCFFVLKTATGVSWS